MMPARSNGGRPCAATSRNLINTANPGTSPADLSNAKPSCSGLMTADINKSATRGGIVAAGSEQPRGEMKEKLTRMTESTKFVTKFATKINKAMRQ
jgi:hypothetical protein